MAKNRPPTFKETLKLVIDDWKKALTGSYPTAALWVATAILAILAHFLTLKDGAQFPTAPAAYCGIAALAWCFVSLAISGVKVAHTTRTELYNLQSELETERDKSKPKINLTITRLTVDAIGRGSGLGGAYVLAWVMVRNDGRDTRLRKWQVHLRTDGEPIGIGPRTMLPGDVVDEFTHTDTGGNGESLTWHVARSLEASTEKQLTQSNDAEGYMLAKLPDNCDITLPDLRDRLYVQCEDSVFKTARSPEIAQAIHPGKIDIKDANGKRVYR